MPAVMLGVFALTLFCSASLIFLVEPMVGKMMLPLLGGTPAVWNTCMVFFQAILLLGYGYAHISSTWLGPRKQAALHLGVLALPLLFFVVNGPLTVNKSLIDGNEANPVPALLLVLTLTVGIPMFVVCTSAPLLQKWFADTDHPAAKDPYFLYGASNLGSMLALIGYPAIVEPFFTLEGQRVYWAIGYGLLAGFTGLCAYLMWKSNRPASTMIATSTGSTVLAADPVPAPVLVSEAIKPADEKIRKKQPKKHPPLLESPPPPPTQTVPDILDFINPATQPVTWLRRLYWVGLAFVPSSLMLGATTHITTDIAAIPLLWVLPLTLYLLTFILVFSQIQSRVQGITIFSILVALLALGAWQVAPIFLPEDSLWIPWALALGLSLISIPILKLQDKHLIHRSMIMVMPLLVLLLLFMVLSDAKPPSIVANIAIHLVTLFVVSMVCHGELARDRPDPRHLTEFFLWMSIGGVLGGLFNALLAPVVFNSLLEYKLVFLVACLLLPPLGFARRISWTRQADLTLAGVFLFVAALLFLMRYLDKNNPPNLKGISLSDWLQLGITFVVALALGSLAAYKGLGVPPAEDGGESPDTWVDKVLDVAMPVALMILVIALDWGLAARRVRTRVDNFATLLTIDKLQFATILTFGLPCVLCYTFVERSVRFGLGIGAILLAGSFLSILSDRSLFQDRSFFGVLKIQRSWVQYPGDERLAPEYIYPVNTLMHGTTLHGKQILQDGLREVPLSYYHRTGPVGHVFRVYNDDPKRRIGVIGLGTGTMACYAIKDQQFDFYDIDPVVKKIAFDTDEYFTFVADAKKRGAKLDLIMGDARLTMDRKQLPDNDKYRIIVIDAFSSDAIPMHLITREAMEVYLDKLAPDGILCFHISNRYLDLAPVLAGLTELKDFYKSAPNGLVGYEFSDDDRDEAGKDRSHWVAISRKKSNLTRLLRVPRWRSNNTQMALLTMALWPAEDQGLHAASRFCWALQGAFNEVAVAKAHDKAVEMGAEKASKSDKEKQKTLLTYQTIPSEWTPLETDEELARKLEDAEARLETLRTSLKSESKEEIKQSLREEGERVRNELAELRRKEKMKKKVGVWTDDYSNLLSVFNWGG